jgi:hypothetical protein
MPLRFFSDYKGQLLVVEVHRIRIRRRVVRQGLKDSHGLTSACRPTSALLRFWVNVKSYVWGCGG